VLAAGVPVGEPHRLEEDGDAHAHADRKRYLDVVRVLDAEPGRVPGQHQEAPLRDVGGDHLQLVAVPEFDVLPADQVPEGPHASGVEQPAHPPHEVLALVDPQILQEAQGRSKRETVLQGLVLEAVVVKLRDDLLQLVRAVAGDYQGGHDRASEAPAMFWGS
jgi:hypothetical protein